MYTDIKTFEDACKVLNLDPAIIIPDFSLFPESDRQAMIDHTKLVIIAKAINGDWVPDWNDWDQYKYHPWFKMVSPSGGGFSCYGYDSWLTLSAVGSRLCFQTRDMAKYAGKQFEELYKSYFVKA
ncbi:hypothetical protein QWY99_06155 [Flavobacterium branchiarum]|uniref:Uncharacterized protein n=1 Tax=Flavobacterium branchiarum TaxID=1114870 RepID=A0ABV5FJ37_9FLAO|nr:hypothetical protein [Flavobacterium branchiarum]MDN3672636.1 hypothetical protein [Flavobacterium branchiarum]